MKQHISVFAIISILLSIIVGVLYILADTPAIADSLNSGICHVFRQLMASLTSFIPFSVYELIIASIPLILGIVIFLAVRAFSSGRGIRFIINLTCIVLIIFSGHNLALGIGYKTTDIGKKMGLNSIEVTVENLTEVMTMLRGEVNSLADTVPRNDDGVFDPGYSYAVLSDKILDSYDNLSSKYDLPKNFYSSAKGVYFGNVMSYFGITGIYTYYTGEANVNTAYPAYVTIFTTAHEMSHQRGILRENEANFVAYLLTATSDDEALRYSAALNMYNYFATALYKTDKDVYYSLASKLSPSAKVDIQASRAVSEKYGDTILEKISDFINDTYLKSSGSEGIISYSKVVKLVLAYYEDIEK